LEEFGIRAIIGTSFGGIFYANCFQNGVLPIVLDKEIVDELAAGVELSQGAGTITIDLEDQTITSPSGKLHAFTIDPRRREGLLGGLDEIDMTLRRDDEIRAFQTSDRARRPWIYFGSANS
jgi:3-isopropylmalate/(R)-2-methylmalate dehydratase small subunit